MKTLSMTWASCAVALMLTVSGCYAGGRNAVKPSKNYVTEKVSISDIEAIRSSSSVDVVYTQASGTPYAEIYAPDNIVPLVKVEQEGKALKIGFKSNTSIQGRYKCEVRVFAPEVTSFSTSSASDITLANGLKTSKPVTLKASSSGDIDASSIQCGDLSMTTSSSGDIKAGTITCAMLALDTQSSGEIKLASATCTGATIESSSSGDCVVSEMACSGDVKASTSSSSDIKLAGTCRNASFSASSAGNIYAKDLLAKDVEARASSAGDIECNASGVLSTSVSSAGGVRYKGEPARVEGKIKGVSKL
jgi:hypothetical protein